MNIKWCLGVWLDDENVLWLVMRYQLHPEKSWQKYQQKQMSFLKKLFRLGGCSRLYSPDSVEAGIVMMEEEGECLECGLEIRDNVMADLGYIPWTSPGQHPAPELHGSWLPEVSFPFTFKLLGNGCIDTNSSLQSSNNLLKFIKISKGLRVHY